MGSQDGSHSRSTTSPPCPCTTPASTTRRVASSPSRDLPVVSSPWSALSDSTGSLPSSQTTSSTRPSTSSLTPSTSSLSDDDSDTEAAMSWFYTNSPLFGSWFVGKIALLGW